MAPSTAVFHATAGWSSAGVDGPAPVRAGSWWYSGQSANCREGALELAVGAGNGLGETEGRAEEDEGDP